VLGEISIHTSRIILVLSLVCAVGTLEPMFEKSFGTSFIALIVCVLVFLLVRKKAITNSIFD